MVRQWNFIIENKIITVYEKTVEKAEQLAHELFKELKESK